MGAFMTTSQDILRLFKTHPETPRIVGFGWNAGVMRDTLDDDNPNKAIAITAQLLDPDSHEQSGKWLFLQLQPEDAMILAKCILQVAKDRGWPEPDAKIVRTRFSDSATIH